MADLLTHVPTPIWEFAELICIDAADNFACYCYLEEDNRCFLYIHMDGSRVFSECIGRYDRHTLFEPEEDDVQYSLQRLRLEVSKLEFMHAR